MMKRQILTLLALGGGAVLGQSLGQAAVLQSGVKLAPVTASAGAPGAIVMLGATRAGYVPDRSDAANIDYSGKVKLKI